MNRRTIGERHRRLILISICVTQLLLYPIVSWLSPDLPLLIGSIILVAVLLPVSFLVGSFTKSILMRRFLNELLAGPLSVVPGDHAPATTALDEGTLRPIPSSFYVVGASGEILAGPHTLALGHDSTSVVSEGTTKDAISELSNGMVVHTSDTGRLGPPAFILEHRRGASWDELMDCHEASLRRATAQGLDAVVIDDPRAFFERQEEAERQWIATQPKADVIKRAYQATRSHHDARKTA